MTLDLGVAAMQVSSPDVNYVRDLVRRRAAIVIDDGQQYLIVDRLSAVARDRGFASTPELITATRTDAVLQTAVVEALTTNETSFFRDVAPFDCLKRDVLPALAAARAETTKTLTIWSAACSTGQEPYSLAMLLLEYLGPAAATWKLRVIATDFSDAVLERARAGKFKQLEVNRGLPVTLLLKYFERTGTEWTIKPEVRRLVEFSQLNLAATWSHRADVVFLRNVLIYFDTATKAAILAKMHATIPADGALFLGAAESVVGLDTAWSRLGRDRAVYYRRTP